MTAAADKTRAVAHYTQLAAQASMLPASAWPGLTGRASLLADERRSNAKRCEVTIPFKGTVWKARLESDGDDGWWIEAVQVDGQWLDAIEVFLPAFLDEMEHAYRESVK